MLGKRVSRSTEILIILSTLVIANHLSAEPPHKPVVPLEPAALIKLMPPTPAGWELRQSTAKNFFVEWLCGQATREYLRIPPNTSTTDTAAPPQITTLKLIDTGYFPGFNGSFANFQVGKYGAFESLVITGMQARRSKLAANREALQVSVRGRFIVSVEVQNQPANSTDGWLRIVDFQNLARIPDTGSSDLPKPIIISSIDELKPSKNSTSKLFWGGLPSPTKSP